MRLSTLAECTGLFHTVTTARTRPAGHIPSHHCCFEVSCACCFLFAGVLGLSVGQQPGSGQRVRRSTSSVSARASARAMRPMARLSGAAMLQPGLARAWLPRPVAGLEAAPRHCSPAVRLRIVAKARPRRPIGRSDPSADERGSEGWSEQQLEDWAPSYAPQKPLPAPRDTQQTLLGIIDAGALLGAAGGAAAALITEQLAFAALPLVLPLLSLLASRQRENLRQQVRY